MRAGSKVPKMGLHKGKGLARIVVRGKTIYLGKWGSAEARQNYAKEIAKLDTGRRAAPSKWYRVARLRRRNSRSRRRFAGPEANAVPSLTLPVVWPR